MTEWNDLLVLKRYWDSLLLTGLSLRVGDWGFPPATMNVAPECSQKKIGEKEIKTRRKRIEPKETCSCLILCLLVIFTQQLEILVTTSFNCIKSWAYTVCTKRVNGSLENVTLRVSINNCSRSLYQNWTQYNRNSEWCCTWLHALHHCLRMVQLSCMDTNFVLGTRLFDLCLLLLMFWKVKQKKKVLQHHRYIFYENN